VPPGSPSTRARSFSLLPLPLSLLVLHITVSNNPRSFPLPFVRNGALTSSPERPLRPLPAPAAVDAGASPLTPRCAHELHRYV
jgi:hypothetical protein